MRKTPSYLKGLAEDRARADGDAIRLQGLRDELAPAVAEAQRTLSLHGEILEQHTVARTKRDACDTLIRSFDSRLDPAQIAPIHGFKGKYGKRGSLREALVDILRSAAPAEVSTPDVFAEDDRPPEARLRNPGREEEVVLQLAAKRAEGPYEGRTCGAPSRTGGRAEQRRPMALERGARWRPGNPQYGCGISRPWRASGQAARAASQVRAAFSRAVVIGERYRGGRPSFTAVASAGALPLP